mmetsp:Transcript_5437/g.15554  ORF Transcript_5437/g.15554 Transcript_5437/m.15554 type:complete len:239 (+) Transcript_5437:1019-1735(+)
MPWPRGCTIHPATWHPTRRNTGQKAHKRGLKPRFDVMSTAVSTPVISSGRTILRWQRFCITLMVMARGAFITQPRHRWDPGAKGPLQTPLQGRTTVRHMASEQRSRHPSRATRRVWWRRYSSGSAAAVGAAKSRHLDGILMASFTRFCSLLLTAVKVTRCSLSSCCFDISSRISIPGQTLAIATVTVLLSLCASDIDGHCNDRRPLPTRISLAPMLQMFVHNSGLVFACEHSPVRRCW